MANRMFNQFQGSLEKGVVQLYAEISYSGGVATLVNGKGIASVSQASGLTRLTLQDSYVKVLNISALVKRLDATPPNVPFLSFRIDDLSVDNSIVLRTATTANVADVPADGVRLMVTLTLSNSTAL